MTAKVKHCTRCSNAMEPKTLERVSAGEGSLKLHLIGLPVLQCVKGHAAPAHRDFMLWFLRELRERSATAIPGGVAKGLLFKKHFCSCGSELPGKPERSGSFAMDLAFEGVAAFKAEVEVPVYRCPGCGKEQAQSAKELAANVPAIVAPLNDAAGFPHSG